MAKYMVFDLDRYNLNRSVVEFVESEITDIKEFFEDYVGEDVEGYEVLEEGNVLVVDGEEDGFYVKKVA